MEPQKKNKESALHHWAPLIGAIAALISAVTGTIVAVYNIKRPAFVPSPTVQTEKTPRVRVNPSLTPLIAPESSPRPSPTTTESFSPFHSPSFSFSTSPIPSSSPSVFPSPSVEPKKVEIPVEPPPQPSPTIPEGQATVSPSPQATN